jgi:uroporphyrinogen-III synthase
MSNLKVKTILVSQPEPKVENSPYFELQQKHKVKVDFRSFIHVEGVSAKDIRAQKIDLNNFSAIILTSRNSVDHFFRVAEEMRYKVPEDLKYFCQSEAIAFYLQKYVVYRKRKIYVGQKDFADMTTLFKKYKDEKFLLPASDQLNFDIPQTLNALKLNWTPATFYKTVMSDLSDLADVYYDILAFFSPSGIKSLFMNFPDFEQNNTRIAVFGSTTQKEALEHGLRIDIMAPSPGTPSMTGALEKYVAEVNKGK